MKLSFPMVVSAAVLFAASAHADLINGSISFAGRPTLDKTAIASATKVTNFARERVIEVTGDYATLGVPVLFGVDFFPFTFNPEQGAVNPLWSFNYNSTSFAFEATTMSATFFPGAGSDGVWVVVGDGLAKIQGYTDTPGTYTLSLGKSGSSLSFQSTAAAYGVPDGGVTLILLGSALSGLALFRRRV